MTGKAWRVDSQRKSRDFCSGYSAPICFSLFQNIAKRS